MITRHEVNELREASTEAQIGLALHLFKCSDTKNHELASEIISDLLTHDHHKTASKLRDELKREQGAGLQVIATVLAELGAREFESDLAAVLPLVTSSTFCKKVSEHLDLPEIRAKVIDCCLSGTSTISSNWIMTLANYTKYPDVRAGLLSLTRDADSAKRFDSRADAARKILWGASDYPEVADYWIERLRTQNFRDKGLFDLVLKAPPSLSRSEALAKHVTPNCLGGLLDELAPHIHSEVVQLAIIKIATHAHWCGVVLEGRRFDYSYPPEVREKARGMLDGLLANADFLATLTRLMGTHEGLQIGDYLRSRIYLPIVQEVVLQGLSHHDAIVVRNSCQILKHVDSQPEIRKQLLTIARLTGHPASERALQLLCGEPLGNIIKTGSAPRIGDVMRSRTPYSCTPWE
jgi:hypothetical protein